MKYLTLLLIHLLSIIQAQRPGTLHALFGHKPLGPAILLEFDIDGVKYGICSFYRNNEETQIEYEWKKGVMHAQSSKPDVLDPLFWAKFCKLAAIKSHLDRARSLVPMSDQQRKRTMFMMSKLKRRIANAGRTPRFGGTFSPWGFSFGHTEKTGTNNFPQFGVPSLKGLLVKVFHPDEIAYGEHAGQIDLSAK